MVHTGFVSRAGAALIMTYRLIAFPADIRAKVVTIGDTLSIRIAEQLPGAGPAILAVPRPTLFVCTRARAVHTAPGIHVAGLSGGTTAGLAATVVLSAMHVVALGLADALSGDALFARIAKPLIGTASHIANLPAFTGFATADAFSPRHTNIVRVADLSLRRTLALPAASIAQTFVLCAAGRCAIPVALRFRVAAQARNTNEQQEGRTNPYTGRFAPRFETTSKIVKNSHKSS